MLCTQDLNFDTGQQVVASGGWVQLLTLQLGGNTKSVGLQISNTGASLTHLKLTRSFERGAHQNNVNSGTGDFEDFVVDSDFNTATDEVIDVISSAGNPPNISTLASAGQGQIHLFDLDAVEEIGLWAQCGTSTNVRVVGSRSTEYRK